MRAGSRWALTQSCCPCGEGLRGRQGEDGEGLGWVLPGHVAPARVSTAVRRHPTVPHGAMASMAASQARHPVSVGSWACGHKHTEGRAPRYVRVYEVPHASKVHRFPRDEHYVKQRVKLCRALQHRTGQCRPLTGDSPAAQIPLGFYLAHIFAHPEIVLNLRRRVGGSPWPRTALGSGGAIPGPVG